MAALKLNCRNQASAQRLTQALPFTAYLRVLVYSRKTKPSCCHHHFSIQSRQVPCAKVAAPFRKAAQTPPISHRFVSAKYIYYCRSKNWEKKKREKAGVQVPIPGNARSVSLFAGGHILESSSTGWHHPQGCCWEQRGCYTPDYARDSPSCAGRNHGPDRAAGISALPFHLQISI